MRTSASCISPATASRAAAALIGTTALFQVALAAGAPWGTAAWGGQHPGTLPQRLRRASAVSALVLGSLAVVAWDPVRRESGAGAAAQLDPALRRQVLLGATGYFALGTVMNAVSRSPTERALWTPVALTTSGLLWLATRS